MKYRLVIFFFLALTACENVSFSPLIGKWQLQTVEKNGEVTPVDTVWYNFQSISIFALQIYESQRDDYLLLIGLRTQEDKTVSIRIFDDYTDDVANFSDWKIVNRSFTIEKLNRRRLILRSEEGYIYSFIKF